MKNYEKPLYGSSDRIDSDRIDSDRVEIVSQPLFDEVFPVFREVDGGFQEIEGEGMLVIATRVGQDPVMLSGAEAKSAVEDSNKRRDARLDALRQAWSSLRPNDILDFLGGNSNEYGFGPTKREDLAILMGHLCAIINGKANAKEQERKKQEADSKDESLMAAGDPDFMKLARAERLRRIEAFQDRRSAILEKIHQAYFAELIGPDQSSSLFAYIESGGDLDEALKRLDDCEKDKRWIDSGVVLDDSVYEDLSFQQCQALKDRIIQGAFHGEIDQMVKDFREANRNEDDEAAWIDR